MMTKARMDELVLESLGRHDYMPIDVAPTSHARLIRSGAVEVVIDRAGQRCVRVRRDSTTALVRIYDARPFYGTGLDLTAQAAALTIHSAIACARFEYPRAARLASADHHLGRKANLFLRLDAAVRPR